MAGPRGAAEPAHLDGARDCADLVSHVDSVRAATLIAFDWDDTLTPTSWLPEIADATTLGPRLLDQMASLSRLVSETLRLASTLGEVVIITDSPPGWVAQSCRTFMPQLSEQVSALRCLARPLGGPADWKTSAFGSECQRAKNVVSVGDGPAERAASLLLRAPSGCTAGDAVAAPGGGVAPLRRVKSIMLVRRPTCEQLIAEHKMLAAQLANAVGFQGSMDLRVRFRTPGARRANLPPVCTLGSFSAPVKQTTLPVEVRSSSDDPGAHAQSRPLPSRRAQMTTLPFTLRPLPSRSAQAGKYTRDRYCWAAREWRGRRQPAQRSHLSLGWSRTRRLHRRG